ncbi:hypothetical protein ACJX0J_020597, partial [Zea mays]
QDESLIDVDQILSKNYITSRQYMHLEITFHLFTIYKVIQVTFKVLFDICLASNDCNEQHIHYSFINISGIDYERTKQAKGEVRYIYFLNKKYNLPSWEVQGHKLLKGLRGQSAHKN